MRFSSAWSSALCLYSQMSPSSPTSMSLSCPGLCRFATCLFQICSQLSRLLWKLLCFQAFTLSKARSLMSLGFPLSALGIYQVHNAAPLMVFPDEATHSEHCESESEGEDQVAWEMRKRWYVLFSACPRVQGVPHPLGWRWAASIRDCSGRLHVQMHTAGWDLPQGADGDGQIQLGITTVTQEKPLGTGPMLCLSLRWRAGCNQPCLKSSRGAGSAASWGHSKHVIGQEGPKEWSKIHEVQLGLTKLPFVMKCLLCGLGGE